MRHIRRVLFGLLPIGVWFILTSSANSQMSTAGPRGIPIPPPEGMTPEVPSPLTKEPEVFIPLPTKVWAQDLPNDNGTGLVVIFEKAEGETEEQFYIVLIAESPEGPWYEAVRFPADTSFKDDYSSYFPGFFWFRKHKEPRTWHAAVISEVSVGERVIPEKGKNYYLKLLAEKQGRVVEYPQLMEARTRVNWFHTARTNNLIFAVIFGAVILYYIALARKDPNLYIRKIAGLEAVDEAIGRATEMGKPILYLNGMDPLSTLSTLASLNILGRVARRVANYDSELLVPSKDPVVLSVAQEVVKQGYLDAGRPDAYKEDNVFFLTEDQFAYTASVCGIMVRDKPAANIFMGYYYAESLILAETGATTGAIQIAGTDSTSQLPFFVTTCDYTLIGEELYAASAYLAREPRLLGSLKGQDVGKLFIMIVILVGTILASVGFMFVRDLFKALG